MVENEFLNILYSKTGWDPAIVNREGKTSVDMAKSEEMKAYLRNQSLMV